MLEWSLKQTDHPVAIRVPANGVISSSAPVDADYSKLNRYQITKRGKNAAILALGSFYQLGESVAAELKKSAGIDVTLINPRYISGVDSALLEKLKHDHQVVVTLEDGILDGGFGEKIARYYGPSGMKVLNYGARKKFVDRYAPAELLKANRLTPAQITEDIRTILNS